MMPTEARTCSKCSISKSLSCFSPKMGKSGIPGYQSECKDCRGKRERDRRQSSTWKASNSIYKTTDAAKARNLRAGRSEKGKATRKRYAQSAKGVLSAQRCRSRRASKAEIRIQNSMHEQLRRMMKSSWKESHLLSTIGSSRDALMKHFENTMTDGMTWENYGYKPEGYMGGWDVDHIIPKTQYDHNDEEERKKCWSLANMRPLWHVDNLKKSNKTIASLCNTVDSMLWPKQWNGHLPIG